MFLRPGQMVRLEKGIYVPFTPPQPKQPCELQSIYRAKHKYCPKCGGTDYWQTCKGCGLYFESDLETHIDDNACHCNCGWSGIIHDLTEQPIDNTTDESPDE